MSHKKIDRRKQYTRKVLKESLIQLLKTEPIATISVKALCEKADINRSTFYAHYQDVFDLLTQIEDEIITGLKSYLAKYNYDSETEMIQMTEKLVEFIASEHQACVILLSPNGQTSFEQKVRALVQTHILKYWHQIGFESERVLAYSIAFILSGSIEVIHTWLKTGMKETPQEMANMIVSFINQGLVN